MDDVLPSGIRRLPTDAEVRIAYAWAEREYPGDRLNVERLHEFERALKILVFANARPSYDRLRSGKGRPSFLYRATVDGGQP